VKESDRVATGARVTYLAKDETYHMTGTPVDVVEIKRPDDCKKSIGAVLVFQRAVDSVNMKGNNLIRMESAPIACPAGTQ